MKSGERELERERKWRKRGLKQGRESEMERVKATRREWMCEREKECACVCVRERERETERQRERTFN